MPVLHGRSAIFAIIAGFAIPNLALAQTSSPPPPPAAAVSIAAEDAAIRTVIEQFKAAIVAKDSAALKSLFYDGKVVWLSSGHPSSRRLVQTMTGQAVPVVEQRGAFEMLDDPRLKSIALEERFYNSVIRTDGQIATVTFDYDFRAQGQVANWGAESWQMVKTDAGWRILSLLFSFTLVQDAPPPANR